jgi:hypothetical protein
MPSGSLPIFSPVKKSCGAACRAVGGKIRGINAMQRQSPMHCRAHVSARPYKSLFIVVNRCKFVVFGGRRPQYVSPLDIVGQSVGFGKYQDVRWGNAPGFSFGLTSAGDVV